MIWSTVSCGRAVTKQSRPIMADLAHFRPFFDPFLTHFRSFDFFRLPRPLDCASRAAAARASAGHWLATLLFDHFVLFRSMLDHGLSRFYRRALLCRWSRLDRWSRVTAACSCLTAAARPQAALPSHISI